MLSLLSPVLLSLCPFHLLTCFLSLFSSLLFSSQIFYFFFPFLFALSSSPCPLKPFTSLVVSPTCFFFLHLVSSLLYCSLLSFPCLKHLFPPIYFLSLFPLLSSLPFLFPLSPCYSLHVSSSFLFSSPCFLSFIHPSPPPPLLFLLLLFFFFYNSLNLWSYIVLYGFLLFLYLLSYFDCICTFECACCYDHLRIIKVIYLSSSSSFLSSSTSSLFHLFLFLLLLFPFFLFSLPSFLLLPPPLPQGHRDNTNVTFVNCVPYPLSNQMHPKIHSVMIFLVYFLVPLAIISVYYYHIARTLIKSAHDMPGELSEHTKRQVSCERTDGWAALTLTGDSAGFRPRAHPVSSDPPIREETGNGWN